MLDQIVEADPLEVLHGDKEEVALLVLAKIIDDDAVALLEFGSGDRLGAEALAGHRVPEQALVKDLDRATAPHRKLRGFEDGSITSLPQQRDQLEAVGEDFADHCLKIHVRSPLS